MKIYLDNNLGVSNVEQEELTQDTIGYNILKVYIPNAVLTPYDTFMCYYGALLQNGRKVGWFAMEARTSTDADYEANYTLYKATLEQCVVSVEGKVYIGCQVLLGNSGNATLIKKNTAVVQFNVRKSVAINNDILVLDTDQTTTDVLESYKNLLENALTTYATKAATYTKTEVNSALALKADKSDTYTKTEVDNATLNLAGQIAGARVELNNRINTTNNILVETNAKVASLETDVDTLQNDVENLKSVQNVVEVVATKSALNSYDTTKLDANDKVQVIADETHDGASTIYNWSGSVWQYVGAYGTNAAPKATAVTHLGNQLKDCSDNNIYPIVANESITPIKLDRIYVNGIVGKNKFDYTSLQQGYCSDVDGSFSTSTAWHYTKVDVSNFTSGHIQLSGTLTYAKIAFFNSSNQFISGWSGSSSATTKNFTISTLSQTPKYFYISILSSNDGTNIQVEDHDGATTFEEYKGILNNNSINEAQTTFMNDLIYLSKNMLDVVDKSNQYCSLTNNNDGSWLISNNNTTNVSRLMLIKEIYLEIGDYSLSSNVVNDDGSDYGGIYIYDTNTMTHKIISITYGTYISNKGVFTISTSGTYYIYASTPSNSTKTFTCYAQLEKGLQTTQWVKAYGQVIINEATKKYIDLNFVSNNEIKSLLNISKLKNTYRYLVPTFYGSMSDGLIILGTNDLRTFDLIYKKGIFTATKTFNNGANTNTLRDPAIIQINDYYYFVYSIMSFVTGDNKIGMCRTKDFITFEELDNISIDDPTSTHTYIAIWAPDWFRNGNKIYLSMTGKYGNTNFETVVYEYNPETHTISNGFVKSFDGRIDGHFYKLNGNYYCAIGGFHLFKSTSLDGTYTEISIGSTYANCEASFIVRKDDGTYRFYAQQLSAHYGTAHMIYKDSVSTNLDDGFGDVNFVEYTDKALDYAKEIHNNAETLNDEYWHWTIFDFNNSNFNNNNFTE